MKKVILLSLATLFSFHTSYAASWSLVCTSGKAYEAFSALLDNKSFDPDSGLFDIKNAQVIDNYARAKLVCAGHRLNEITCVGFWFERGDQIVKVSLQKKNGRFEAIHSQLEGGLIHNTSPWPCKVR